MPTYDYECLECGHTFEAFQSMSEEPLKKCPQCGKKVRRLIGGGVGIIFKGSGFYVTDNKNGGKNGSGGKEKSPASSSTSSESKNTTSSEKPGDKEKSSNKKSA